MFSPFMTHTSTGTRGHDRVHRDTARDSRTRRRDVVERDASLFARALGTSVGSISARAASRERERERERRGKSDMILDVVRASNRAGVRAMAVVTVVMTWKSVMRLDASRGDAARDVARFLCAWAMTYYGLLFNQSGAAFEEAARLRARAKKDGARPPKMYEVKYSLGGVTSREVLCADRTVGNFMEQSLALVPALLAHFYVFGGTRGVRFAWAWLVVRWAYGAAFRKGLPWFIFITVPNYACVFALYVDLARYAGLLT